MDEKTVIPGVYCRREGEDAFVRVDREELQAFVQKANRQGKHKLTYTQKKILLALEKWFEDHSHGDEEGLNAWVAAEADCEPSGVSRFVQRLKEQGGPTPKQDYWWPPRPERVVHVMWSDSVELRF